MKKIYTFNKTKHGSYSIITTATPYLNINKKKLLKPKFVFRKSFELAEKKFRGKIKNKKILDIGCANGEFINFLNYKTKKKNIIEGIDIFEHFIKVAKKNFKDSNIKFLKKDIFRIKKKYDLIFCICTAQIFPDITPLLRKTIQILNKNGVVIFTGRFNENKIDAIIKFKDSISNKWRCDFNIHSQKTINNFLKKYKDKIKWNFEKHYIDVQIERKKSNPDIYHYTYNDKMNNIRITSGLLQDHDNYFLTIKKK